MQQNETIITNSPEETMRLAKKLAQVLKIGDILALEGELGSGKTCFVQGLAAGLNISDKRYVRSPSFTLINEYLGETPLYHFDFYRLVSQEEVEGLGVDEYFDGNGITVVEWADKFPGALPKRTIHIKFEMLNETSRKISIGNNILERR